MKVVSGFTLFFWFRRSSLDTLFQLGHICVPGTDGV